MKPLTTLIIAAILAAMMTCPAWAQRINVKDISAKPVVINSGSAVTARNLITGKDTTYINWLIQRKTSTSLILDSLLYETLENKLADLAVPLPDGSISHRIGSVWHMKDTIGTLNALVNGMFRQSRDNESFNSTLFDQTDRLLEYTAKLRAQIDSLNALLHKRRKPVNLLNHSRIPKNNK